MEERAQKWSKDVSMQTPEKPSHYEWTQGEVQAIAGSQVDDPQKGKTCEKARKANSWKFLYASSHSYQSSHQVCTQGESESCRWFPSRRSSEGKQQMRKPERWTPRRLWTSQQNYPSANSLWLWNHRSADYKEDRTDHLEWGPTG